MVEGGGGESPSTPLPQLSLLMVLRGRGGEIWEEGGRGDEGEGRGRGGKREEERDKYIIMTLYIHVCHQTYKYIQEYIIEPQLP